MKRECGPLIAVGPDVYDECHNEEKPENARTRLRSFLESKMRPISRLPTIDESQYMKLLSDLARMSNKAEL
jgi:hypothetical protein